MKEDRAGKGGGGGRRKERRRREEKVQRRKGVWERQTQDEREQEKKLFNLEGRRN